MTFPKLALSALFLLAAFAGLTLWRAHARERAAEAAYPPEGQIVEVAGQRVHLVVQGRAQGEAPDVVLIHGSSGSTRDMTFALAPALAERYRVISVDRPGLGWSARDADGASLARQAQLLQGAVAQVGADRPIVVGQSYGGAVALTWALDYPDQTAALVTLSSPAFPWEGGLSLFYKITSSALGQALIVPLITAWVPRSKITSELQSVFKPQTMPEGYGDYFGPRMTLRRSALAANGEQRAALKPQMAAMVARYRDMTLPVEIVHGTADTTVSPRIHALPLLAALPNAAYTPLDGIGHMPQHVAIPQVVAAIDRAAARAQLR